MVVNFFKRGDDVVLRLIVNERTPCNWSTVYFDVFVRVNCYDVVLWEGDDVFGVNC